MAVARPDSERTPGPRSEPDLPGSLRRRSRNAGRGPAQDPLRCQCRGLEAETCRRRPGSPRPGRQLSPSRNRGAAGPGHDGLRVGPGVDASALELAAAARQVGPRGPGDTVTRLRAAHCQTWVRLGVTQSLRPARARTRCAGVLSAPRPVAPDVTNDGRRARPGAVAVAAASGQSESPDLRAESSLEGAEAQSRSRYHDPRQHHTGRQAGPAARVPLRHGPGDSDDHGPLCDSDWVR